MPIRPTAPAQRLTHAASLLLVLALAVGACGDRSAADATAPSALRATQGAPPSAAVQGAAGATDPALALDAAWNAGDEAAFAASYIEDGELINPIGVVLAGRSAVQAAHAFLFSGPFRGSHRATEVRRVTHLTGTIAVVDLDVRLTGFVGLPPGLRPTAPGLVLTRERQIVEKRGGEWRIAMAQITAVPPAP